MGSIVGGGSGGFLSSIGSIVGGIFGGPVGAMIGQMIGGMVQNMLGQAMQDNGVDQQTQDSANQAYNQAYTEASGGLEPAASNGATTSEQINQFADAANLSDADRGTLQRLGADLNTAIADATSRGAADAAGGTEATNDTKGKGSWLMALAKALGGMAGKSAANIVKLSGELTKLGDEKANAAGGDDPKAKEQAAADYNEKNTELQGASQEFSLLMNTISTTLKSLGEGMSTVARKQ